MSNFFTRLLGHRTSSGEKNANAALLSPPILTPDWQLNLLPTRCRFAVNHHRELFTLSAMLGRTGAMDDASFRESLVLAIMVGLLANKLTGSLAQETERLLNIIRARTFEIYFDKMGRTVGIALWQMHAHDDQGCQEEPLVTDLKCRDGFLLHILGDLRERVFRTYETCTYVKTRRKQWQIKRVKRSRRSGFFSQQTPRRIHDLTWNSEDEGSVYPLRAHFEKKAQLGHCIRALAAPADARLRPIIEARRLVADLIALRQFHLFFSVQNVPLGLLTWAWITDDTAGDIIAKPMHMLHKCELAEGPVLCVIDMVGHAAGVATVLDELFDQLFPDIAAISFYSPASMINTPAIKAFQRDERCQVRQWLAPGRARVDAGNAVSDEAVT